MASNVRKRANRAFREQLRREREAQRGAFLVDSDYYRRLDELWAGILRDVPEEAEAGTAATVMAALTRG